jgi:hypothetical protein
MRPTLCVGLLTLALSACGAVATLTFTITQTEGRVAGNGAFSDGARSLSVVVTGTYHSPEVTLSIRSAGFESADLTGTVDDLRIIGSLNGSGFVQQAVTLERQ